MASSLAMGRKALAAFFSAVAPQKAHWYNLMSPSEFDTSRDEINRIFPPISSFLNIEVTIMNKVLEACGLCRRKGTDLLVAEQGWIEFIAEYMLDIELTVFTIGKRRRFLRIGSFHKLTHPPKMPGFYWSKGIGPPKLRISKLTNIFAQDVGKMNLRFDDLSDAGSEIESDSSVSNDESMVELSVSVEKVVVSSLETVGAPMDVDVPDPNKFPLLYSLGCNSSNMDRLIQELILFHGNNQISFTRGNNRQGTLVILPSHRHLDRYEADLSKKNLLLILSLMQSPKIREAARKKLRNAFSEVFLISMKMRSFLLPWISVSSAKNLMRRWTSSALRQ
jgi:hypothetical protein